MTSRTAFPAAFAASLVLSGCFLFGGEEPPPAPAAPVPAPEPRRQEPDLPPPSPTHFVFYKEDSALRDSLRTVARTDLQWRQIWDNIHVDEPQVPALPEVDFQRHMLAVAAAGPRNLGDEIQVDSVVWESRQQSPGAPREVVMVLKVRKLEACDAYDVTVHPVVVVRVPLFEGRVEWLERSQEERADCR